MTTKPSWSEAGAARQLSERDAIALASKILAGRSSRPLGRWHFLDNIVSMNIYRFPP